MNNISSLHFSSVQTSIEWTRMFRNTTTSSDRHIVSQYLLDAEQEMRSYDAEINRLQTAIHLLETKKTELKKSMIKCRSLLSPVHRLPTEILLEVFSTPVQDWFLSPLNEGVIKLSRVCGRWRDIIISAPKLWSSIDILFVEWRGKFRCLEKWVRLFLDRSKTLPLELKLEFCDRYTDQDDIGMLPVIHALHDHAARWQDLYLAYAPSTFALPPNHLGLPALQQLQVYEVQADVMSSLLKNSPCLHTLDISDIETGEEPPSNLPSHQIKTWNVSHTDVSPAFRYLARLPVLETIYMHAMGSNDDFDLHNTELRYYSNTVNSLTADFRNQHALNATMQQLTLPRLTSLQVGGYYEGWEDEWPIWTGGAVTDFLSRSSCSLTSLCLRNLPVTDDQAISLLEHIPTLLALEIEERSEYQDPEAEPVPLPNRIITQPFLQRLTVRHEAFRSSPPFLSLLTDITFAMRKDDSIEQSLFNAVASRWIPDPVQAKQIGVKSLKSVTITTLQRKGAPEERRWLKSLESFRDAELRSKVTT
ncbi:hypothetical protein PQX77_017270 [Marasmius sp. AFHP31]|nr:hypothetical protein PQX77_017270 [Marasmius sp. AFHP31]